ncbi:MAG: bifunctional nuclease family protein [Planctomycetota bacterium]
MAVRMELARILIRELTDYQVIELREVADNGAADDDLRSFPIVIGLPEAQAIERRLSGVPVKRPQTHDLLASVLEHLGAALESVAITDLADHTFFAVLNVRDESGDLVAIDARPSDAIALGVATGVPIEVAEHVLASATEPPTMDMGQEFELDDEDDDEPQPPF